ncbi:OpgC family protein [Tabrizicola fusiformis]|uniref:OpgC family protein n=1 Tax=Tabrizicola sp. SY72 TaxID=2741673 RepID=UPI0015737780|nr:OpgC domain-containing protein [Tabrizicola sp. SY72]NTT85931.1 OpgC domain-containing protein [Tabrizicola sp. SY72]
MPETTLPARAPSIRDPRLDVFRGLCLVMIFINHVPGNIYENLTSRNFGFSDAAEGFVLMSGIAAGLAYSMDFNLPGRIWTGLARVWRRVWTLYMVHLVTTAAGLGAVAAVTLWLGDPAPLTQNLMKYLFTQPVKTFVGIPLLTHQLGYLNILPLYLVLLLVSPPVLWLAWRRPAELLAGSVLLWFFAGVFRWNLPNMPIPGGWFFNPLTWQLIFVIGLVTGVGIRGGKRLVPVWRWLVWTCIAFLAFACVMVWVKPLAGAVGYGLWLAADAGMPWNLTSFDKTFVTAPRLLHILALAYVLSAFPAVRAACGSRAAAPFALLGRQALPVFALGSVLCLALQAIKNTTGQNILLDSLMIGGGLALQFALAAARTYWPKPPKTTHHPAVAG